MGTEPDVLCLEDLWFELHRPLQDTSVMWIMCISIASKTQIAYSALVFGFLHTALSDTDFLSDVQSSLLSQIAGPSKSVMSITGLSLIPG